MLEVSRNERPGATEEYETWPEYLYQTVPEYSISHFPKHLAGINLLLITVSKFGQSVYHPKVQQIVCKLMCVNELNDRSKNVWKRPAVV